MPDADAAPAEPSPVDPSRCPLCGEDNACGARRGAGTCWCFSIQISDEVIERIPPALRNVACLCERCASADT